MHDVVGMGEADCDIGISLYRQQQYRSRALVVALEVSPAETDQTRPQHPSPGSLQASLRGVRGPVIIASAWRSGAAAARRFN